MPSRIPLVNLQREYARIRSEIDRAVHRVLRQGRFVLGGEAKAFEDEWAAYCGVPHAVGVGNGSDALQIALRAAGIGPGDEVVVPALSSAFTAMAVSMTGATPVFADVDALRLTLDPGALEAAITPHTKAVIAVHLYGSPADMDPIVQIARNHGLLVLEDASQAHGAPYHDRRTGSLGDVATFGFYPTMNLGAYGDAGALVTGDGDLADKARMLRNGGRRALGEHEMIGTNSRLDEMQAAILRTKLAHLEAWNQHRRTLAARYEKGLSDIPDLLLPAHADEAQPVYYLYVVRTFLRDALREYLAGAGVGSGTHYRRPLHLEEAFAPLGYGPGTCPNAEKAAETVLSLPLYSCLSLNEVDQVVRLIRIFFAMR